MKICKVENCNGKYHSKGLCKKHYFNQWRKDNKEHLREYNEQWFKDNPKYLEQWRKDNKKHRAKQDRKYQQEHKEHYLKQKKEYRKTPTGRASIKADCHNRRAMTRDLTKATVQRVYEDNIK